MPGRQAEFCHAQLDKLRGLIEAESGDGLKLLSSLTNNPICSIYLDGNVPCITVAWKRYATSTQFRYVHESLIALLGKYQVNRILSESTALPTIHLEDQRWIIDDWIPRASAAGLHAVASKKPAAYFARVALENIRSEVSGSIQMRSFDELEAARRWLETLPEA
ncbi:MAG TPA: hypothetical protein VMF64_13220 [Steroidobacteraceae bacterium]|nr:hypothetical protein [Steroidobacteraceae bacterium]